MIDSLPNFGPTGTVLFPLGLGTHGHGHAFGGISREESLAVLESVYRRIPKDQRILIDTAPRYGHGLVESWLGEMADSWSDRFVIASKCGRQIDPERDNQKDFSYSFLASDIEGSLQRLRLDQLFLVQLHNPSLEEIRSGEVFATMERFRDQGLIKWYGVSIDDPTEGIEAIRTCVDHGYRGLASVQFIYSVFTKEGTAELLRLAREANVALIAREVLFRGFLTDSFLLTPRDDLETSAVAKLTKQYGLTRITDAVVEVEKLFAAAGVALTAGALRYALGTPGITTTLIGANKLQYVAEAWSALSVEMPSELREALNRMPDIRPLKSTQCCLTSKVRSCEATI